jgi:CheY-like chemotaxis protein
MKEAPLILVVDDEQNFREIISALLGASGFKVVTAENGEEALDHAEKLKPGLILLDMKMSGMDGGTVLAKLKEKEDMKDIKVIFLSNFGDARKDGQEADQHFSKEAGALDYINKSDIDTKLIPRVKELFA